MSDKGNYEVCKECKIQINPDNYQGCIIKTCPYKKPRLAVVEKIRGGRPKLNDIPGRLRWLADEIEQGNLEDVNSCFVILPVLWDFPGFYAYGDIDGSYNPLIHLRLAMDFWSKKLVGKDET